MEHVFSVWGLPMLNCILVMGLQKHYWFNLWVHIKYATRETGHPVTWMSKWSRGNNEKLYPVLCLAARHSRSVLFVSLLPLCSVFPHHFFLCPKAMSHSLFHICLLSYFLGLYTVSQNGKSAQQRSVEPRGLNSQ